MNSLYKFQLTTSIINFMMIRNHKVLLFYETDLYVLDSFLLINLVQF